MQLQEPSKPVPSSVPPVCVFPLWGQFPSLLASALVGTKGEAGRGRQASALCHCCRGWGLAVLLTVAAPCPPLISIHS